MRDNSAEDATTDWVKVSIYAIKSASVIFGIITGLIGLALVGLLRYNKWRQQESGSQAAS